MGYINCAAELAVQMADSSLAFDYLIHCTGSSSTQAGLLAGFAVLGIKTRVIGVSDDDEIEVKKTRVLQLANEALSSLDLAARVKPEDIEIVTANTSPYGIADTQLKDGIRQLACKEGLIADPVYEGRAIQGLLGLVDVGRIESNANILLMHLGGSPAIHAYAEQFGRVQLQPFNV